MWRLGNKAVEKITVFVPDKGIMPYLLFWVEDAPLPTGGLAALGRSHLRARL